MTVVAIRYDGDNKLPHFLTDGKEYPIINNDAIEGVIRDDEGYGIKVKSKCSTFLRGDDWTLITKNEENKMTVDDIKEGFEFLVKTEVRTLDENDPVCFLELEFLEHITDWVSLKELKELCDEETYVLFEQKHKQLFPELYESVPTPAQQDESSITKLKSALNNAIDERDLEAIETLSKAIQRLLNSGMGNK